MKDFDKLDELYKQYDNETSPIIRKEILKQILELDPEDIDSMHRLVDYVPNKQRFAALLELKERAKKVVYSKIDENEDVYGFHETRPYMFILLDILDYYEEIGDLENAYLTIKEMLQINEGDNLGARFHLIAYYIGHNKISDLQAFIKECPDNYSVAARFAILYLKQLKRKKYNGFDDLYRELPFLYCLLSNEIKLSKKEVINITNSIKYYRPNGFYDCLLFYKLIKIYETKISKSFFLTLIPKFNILHETSIENVLPKITKFVLYSLADIYKNDYSRFIKRLSNFNIQEDDFLSVKKELIDFGVLEFGGQKDDKIFFGEASLALLKMFINKDITHLNHLNENVEYFLRMKM